MHIEERVRPLEARDKFAARFKAFEALELNMWDSLAGLAGVQERFPDLDGHVRDLSQHAAQQRAFLEDFGQRFTALEVYMGGAVQHGGRRLKVERLLMPCVEPDYSAECDFARAGTRAQARVHKIELRLQARTLAAQPRQPTHEFHQDRQGEVREANVREVQSEIRIPTLQKARRSRTALTRSPPSCARSRCGL